jgi:hypothetical protein
VSRTTTGAGETVRPRLSRSATRPNSDESVPAQVKYAIGRVGYHRGSGRTATSCWSSSRRPADVRVWVKPSVGPVV